MVPVQLVPRPVWSYVLSSSVVENIPKKDKRLMESIHDLFLFTLQACQRYMNLKYRLVTESDHYNVDTGLDTLWDSCLLCTINFTLCKL